MSFLNYCVLSPFGVLSSSLRISRLSADVNDCALCLFYIFSESRQLRVLQLCYCYRYHVYHRPCITLLILMFFIVIFLVNLLIVLCIPIFSIDPGIGLQSVSAEPYTFHTEKSQMLFVRLDMNRHTHSPTGVYNPH